MKTTTTTTASTTCSCRVPLFEVAAHLGATEEHAGDLVRQAGHEVAADWCGRPAVGVEVAAEVLDSRRAVTEAHGAKWAAYQSYIEQRRQAAEDERQAAIEKAREEAQEQARRSGKAMSVRAEEESRRAAEQAAAERASKTGAPVPFDKFGG